MRQSTLLTALLLVAAADPLAGQVPPELAARVNRIFGSVDFAPQQRFGPAEWIENGAAYATVESSKEVTGASDIVRYATQSGARSFSR